MPTIQVEYNSTTTSYPIIIKEGILEKAGKYIAKYCLSHRACVISDEKVGKLYGYPVTNSFKRQGIECDLITVPEGESSKSLDVCRSLYTQLINKKYERTHLITALGGGVVGDLAGFVAATFLRGLPYVQVPTSLLAQVDSSVGGKVALNHPQGKNLMGAFYNPKLVLVDPKTLETLPQREIKSGLGEIIKYSLFGDRQFFGYLNNNLDRLLNLSDREVIEKVISRCLNIKASVVRKDMYESDLRKVLNFGHTIGHGIEASTDYGGFKHGEAVILGMHCEAWISWKMGLLKKSQFDRIEGLLERVEIKYDLDHLEEDQLLEKIKMDKKVKSKKINFVLLTRIGSTVIRDDVPEDIITESINYLKGNLS